MEQVNGKLVQIAQILSDKPITSILAGLGVGGLAVALAAQETIKNFFGSLVIFADKPFELDERIRVGDFDGFVEEVSGEVASGAGRASR